jgi:hypothetical protein
VIGHISCRGCTYAGHPHNEDCPEALHNKYARPWGDRRAEFEAYIRRTQKQTQPWDLCERSKSGGGRTNEPEVVNDGYLDLETQLRWEGWKAANRRLI